MHASVVCFELYGEEEGEIKFKGYRGTESGVIGGVGEFIADDRVGSLNLL